MRNNHFPAKNLPLFFGLSALAAVLVVFQGPARAQDESPAGEAAFSTEQIEFFEAKIRPVLVEHCFECHGNDAESPEAGLLLTSRKAILEGGDSGPAIDLTSPGESLILSAIEYGDLFQMPPDSRLSDEQIADFRTWIVAGAAWPTGDSETKSAVSEVFDLEERRSGHWCWHPVVRPAVPACGDGWARDPIDRFVLQRLEEKDLAPAPAASRETWIRRVTFDLAGLPPTTDEIDNFLKDDSPDAFEKVVDRLLASPHFGERWARHWMDLIRYAETCGHEFDYPIPHAWQYRDYLIRALNADVPYNQFVTEHVAGDLVSEPRRDPENEINESVLGTGFWFLGEATHGPVDVKGDEAGRIDNQIDVFGKTFLGLTVACARCHDHKFDAISTKDYYAISGFLQSSRRQEVLLDPGRKIENTLKSIEQQQATARDHASNPLNAVVNNPSAEKDYASHLVGAVNFLRAKPGWHLRKEIRIEGEAIKEPTATAGIVESQSIEEFKSWSGGSQLWWRDAKPGDRLKFAIDVPAKATFRINLYMTVARDYGIVQLYVNDNKAGEPFDGYSPSLGVSGRREFATVELQAGPNNLELEVVGRNESAVNNFMVGIDAVEIVPETEQESSFDEFLKTMQSSGNFLNSDMFARLVGALRDELPIGADSALRQLHALARGVRPVSLEEPDSGETLDLVETGGWSATGFVSLTTPNPIVDLSAPDKSRRWFANGFALHTGRMGNRVQGTIRSPTFVVTQPYIHYLTRASKAKFRVIIDGFQLDVYNPLLFEGVTITADTGGKWQWVTQSRDLKNYLGHRAYVEIVDDSDGFAEVRKVIMSDDPSPPLGDLFPLPAMSEAKAEAKSGSAMDDQAAAEEVRKLADDAARRWVQAIQDIVDNPESASQSNADIVSFLYRYNLFAGADRLIDFDDLEGRRSEMEALQATLPDPVRAVGMTEGTGENEFVFIRGNHKNIGDEVQRQPLSALPQTARWQNLALAGSGRKELAEDLTDPHNPLIYRVMANRIWHHLTGRGIVASVDNFGELGNKPTHPELLDYLSESFRDGGYSVKSLIRQIVLSATYRMDSRAHGNGQSVDPDNEMLSRFRVRRLQGEVIRDAMLQVSGQLNRSLYGPPIPIHLTDFMQGRGRPGSSGPLDGAGRRSIYTEVRRNFLWPMMIAFDTPIPFNTIGKRNVSNVPAQALILLNDPLVAGLSEKWAEKLIAEHESTDERIRVAFRSALGRAPSETEMSEFQSFIKSQAEIHQVGAGDIASSQPVWADFCHVVFNLKEFIYID
jgi:mono/diheme cytochrome c family protein